MFELDDMQKYLMSVAMASYNYIEYLKIDEKKQIDTLGFILRVYQDKINKLKPQELALLITYLTEIDEKYYLEYINLFDGNIINGIIGKSKSIDEQISSLRKIEDIYYQFFCDKDKNVLTKFKESLIELI